MNIVKNRDSGRVGRAWIITVAFVLAAFVLGAHSAECRAGEPAAATGVETLERRTFSEPALVTPTRAPFGVSAGKAEPYTVPAERPSSRLTEVVGWCVVGALACAMVVMIVLMGRGRDERGNARWSFTIAAKLAAGFGTLATLIALVGTLSLHGMLSLGESSDEISGIVDDAELLSDIQTDVLNTRIAVKNFIMRQSDADLAAYSDSAAAASIKIEACKQAIRNPDRVRLCNEVREKFSEYDRVFAEVVRLTDSASGIQASQMGPSADHATKVFERLVHSAEEAAGKLAGADAAGALREAVLASKCEERLQFARMSYFKYLATDNEKFATDALAAMDEGRRLLAQLKSATTDPQRRAAVDEAVAAFTFWSARATESTAKRKEAAHLVVNKLDKLGAAIAEDGDKLVQSIHATRAEVEKSADAAAVSLKTMSVTTCAIAVMLATFVGLLIIRTITSATSMMIDRLRDIAQGEGDLTRRVDINRSDEMGEVAKWFNTFITKVHGIVKEVAQATHEVAAASTQIAASSEEMSASAGEVARQAAGANAVAEESRELARNGGEIVGRTVSGIQAVNRSVSESAQGVKRLGERSDQIGEIIKVINDIADQTNLLALNAAIEAARAGEHGRGFAVVADEVRQLAERTTKSTEQVGESIRSIQQETEASVKRMDAGAAEVARGVQSANQAGESLGQIVTKAESVATMIRAISAAAEEAGAGSQQAAGAASQLSAKAEQLQALVAQFKV